MKNIAKLSMMSALALLMNAPFVSASAKPDRTSEARVSAPIEVLKRIARDKNGREVSLVTIVFARGSLVGFDAIPIDQAAPGDVLAARVNAPTLSTETTSANSFGDATDVTLIFQDQNISVYELEYPDNTAQLAIVSLQTGQVSFGPVYTKTTASLP